MPETITKEKIKELGEKIAREFKPEKIILFGSFAWGTPGPDSDVDLFIVKKTDNTREMARKISGSIMPRLFPIDLIVYTPETFEKRKSDLFIQHIINNGKLLYGV